MPRRKQKTWLPGRVAPAMKPATVSRTVSTKPPPPVCVALLVSRHLLVNLLSLGLLIAGLREGIKKIDFFLGNSPK